MRLFDRILGLFALAKRNSVFYQAVSKIQRDNVQVQRQSQDASSRRQREVFEARRRLSEKRAEREGSWGETQFFKPD